MKKEIKIPDIAENVDTGLIASVLVSKGDTVSKDQPLVEVETDKAATDIPSPYEGVVDEIRVKEGDEVKVGQVIMTIESEEVKEQDKEEAKDKQKEETQDKKNTETGKKEEEKRPVDEDEDEKKKQPASSDTEVKHPSDIPASPSVRRLARELDADIAKIEGTGPGNRITSDDVRQFAEGKKKQAEPKESEALPDFSQWGSVSVKPMDNIRKITAQNVLQSWQTIPHVTQFDEADMTDLENFRKQNQDKISKKGGKLTVTAILLKIAGYALQKFPRFNASLDMNNMEIVYKHYFNIGIAVDTPRGLLVPVVRDVNSKSLADLSVELTEIAKKARNKNIKPEELQGGNFSISNLGGIGGTAFTPIVYKPQVAILGVSAAKYQQVLKDDEFQKRLIIPLSLSYDHRIIDGADGARFLRWICNVIEDPYALLQ
jgi:pyruvate dehydrogenase E2 component (dihydrolipoamide acetyltransferase)